MSTETESVRWSGRALKRRARAVLSEKYGPIFVLGLVSVLLGDWLGGWLRVEVRVGPLHDPFTFPVLLSRNPCEAYGPKVRHDVPVDLLASPEWPAVRDRFGLSDPNGLLDGLFKERVVSGSLEQITLTSPTNEADKVQLHMAWDKDSWRVVRTEWNAETDVPAVDSFVFEFHRLWHLDLFGKPLFAFPSAWAVAAFLLAVLAFGFLVGNPLVVAIRGELLDDCRGVATRPPLRWASVARVLFLRDVSVLLWSLLLVVPGIVKIYEWRLVPFLLADDSALSWRDAARTSRDRMDGHKLDAFLLDLSFAGWWILGCLTFGVLNLLFTVPYYGLTLAGLYETLARGLRLPPPPKTPYDQYQDAIQTNA